MAPPPTPTPAGQVPQATRDRVQRGLLLGLVTFVVFLPLDFAVRAWAYPDAEPAYLLAARLGGAAVLAGSWLALRWRPPSLAQFSISASTTMALVAVCLALVTLAFGGLASPFFYTLPFSLFAFATFVPAPWRRGALMAIPVIAAYLATFLIGVALTPRLAPALADPRALATFGVNAFLVTGMTAFSLVAGHVLATTQARLADARRLGGYLLKSRLGAGGMSEVWLAYDRRMQREVALKLLESHARGSQRARFEREARATSGLHSPHTVRIFDFGANDEGVAWIAMEHLRGLDMESLLAAQGPLDPRRVVHFARQAAASLAEAHASGLIHRDIKPANLMALSGASEADFLKVLDFGIARQLADTASAGSSGSSGSSGSPGGPGELAGLTSAGIIIGTPAFMAPELLAGAPAHPPSDVWAFGVTLYVLLTGALPFDRPTIHVAAPPRPPSAVRGTPLPPELDALVMACLAARPTARPEDGAALLAALTALPIPAWTADEARAAWALAGARASAA